jgi:hypothetical protein
MGCSDTKPRLRNWHNTRLNPKTHEIEIRYEMKIKSEIYLHFRIQGICHALAHSLSTDQFEVSI